MHTLLKNSPVLFRRHMRTPAPLLHLFSCFSHVSEMPTSPPLPPPHPPKSQGPQDPPRRIIRRRTFCLFRTHLSIIWPFCFTTHILIRSELHSNVSEGQTCAFTIWSDVAPSTVRNRVTKQDNFIVEGYYSNIFSIDFFFFMMSLLRHAQKSSCKLSANIV